MVKVHATTRRYLHETTTTTIASTATRLQVAPLLLGGGLGGQDVVQQVGQVGLGGAVLEGAEAGDCVPAGGRHVAEARARAAVLRADVVADSDVCGAIEVG